MSAFKGTPGPWVYKPATGKIHALMAMGGNVVIFKVAPDEADARLMEAAPELLEACQTFAEWLRREDAGFPAETRFNTPEGEAKWREWFGENIRVCALAQEQARAAIAKATGEQA